MQRCGFKNCRVIDVTKTTVEEQRATEWMHFHSLKEFLDTENPDLTCEGLPAPQRAIILANAP
jgi:tRNA (mo5U34)-methyltransferase